MQKNDKIIIDTNLWVSFLLTKKFSFLDSLLTKGDVKLIFCNELLSEFLNVVRRPKLQKYFTEDQLRILLGMMHKYADFVEVRSNVDVCRDKKDNFLLSLAEESSADYLITGDDDLLVLKKFKKTKIITMAEYKRNRPSHL